MTAPTAFSLILCVVRSSGAMDVLLRNAFISVIKVTSVASLMTVATLDLSGAEQWISDQSSSLFFHDAYASGLKTGGLLRVML